MRLLILLTLSLPLMAQQAPTRLARSADVIVYEFTDSRTNIRYLIVTQTGTGAASAGIAIVRADLPPVLLTQPLEKK